MPLLWIRKTDGRLSTSSTRLIRSDALQPGIAVSTNSHPESQETAGLLGAVAVCWVLDKRPLCAGSRSALCFEALLIFYVSIRIVLRELFVAEENFHLFLLRIYEITLWLGSLAPFSEQKSKAKHLLHTWLPFQRQWILGCQGSDRTAGCTSQFPGSLI